MADSLPSSGALDPGDKIEYGLSISESGEYWAKLHATATVRPGENAVQTAERASAFVDALLEHHVKQLRAHFRP